MAALSERLRSSLWPIPLAMLLASVLLVNLTALVDHRLAGSEALQRWWLHSGNGDDARNLLSTLAAAIMTMASVVFSITIVALSLAANQFGTRLVRSYMSDTRTKLALGCFLLTTVFCLLSLRLVTEQMSPDDVPHVTITAALALSITCVLVLVFFLHMVAHSIIADEIVRRVARDLDEAIESLPPQQPPSQGSPATPTLPADFETRSVLVRSPAEGYVQQVNYEALFAHVEDKDVILRIDVVAGDYLCRGGWLGRVYPEAGASVDLSQRIRQAVVIGPERTPVQDIAFSMRHLVDVALRALSPGINDANTALVVIDHLRGALSRLLGKSLPPHVFRDQGGRCRLVGRHRTHADLIATAIRPIRDAAAPHPLVIVSMIQALQKLSEHAASSADFDSLLAEARSITEVGLARPIAQTQASAIRAAAAGLERKILQVRAETGPDPRS